MSDYQVLDEFGYDPTLDSVHFAAVLDSLLPLEHPSHTESLTENWSWQDARLIGVDRGEPAGEQRYEIGAIDLYVDHASGDLGGSYLPIATFADESPATAFYLQLQGQIHTLELVPHQVAEFAEARAMEMHPDPANWRGATSAEYTAYEHLRDLDSLHPALADDPSPAMLDPLLRTAAELGGVAADLDVQETMPSIPEGTAFEAFQAIGVRAENFNPALNPPPFYDAASETAYWVGIFQPDRQDPDNCVASILSLGRNPETGEMQAQLAPCVPGDWHKAYTAAEYLIQVAQKGGMEQVFDTAQGMALATDQRDFWQTERGVALEAESTRSPGGQWEVQL